MLKQSLSKVKDKEGKTRDIFALYEKARLFALKTHERDVMRIRARLENGLVSTWNEFIKEYVYVVLASGFSSKTASSLVQPILRCDGDQEKILKIFKNKRKAAAISRVYKTFRTEFAGDFEKFADEFLRSKEKLKKLPYIGDITVNHIARNIGLEKVGKADVHMKRLASKYGFSGVFEMLEAIHAKHQDVNIGEIDFVLWIYLSHDNGVVNDKCCFGKMELR